MKQSKFDQHRDQQIANEVGVNAALMCSSRGCPNLWSTSDGHLCRGHADAEPLHWPQVTQEAQDAITDRAMATHADRPAHAALTASEKFAVLTRLRTVLSEPKNSRAWIDRLREKRRCGERLSPMQRHVLAQLRNAVA